jgi:hypothetical protein
MSKKCKDFESSKCQWMMCAELNPNNPVVTRIQLSVSKIAVTPMEIRQRSEIGWSESARAEIQTSVSPFAGPNSRLKGRYKIPLGSWTFTTRYHQE